MLANQKVIFGLRWGEVSGVDIFSSQLARGLIEAGVPSRILLTRSSSLFQLPIATDLPIDRLDVEEKDSWRVRWRKMIRYLESQAPCIYIPNYDYNYSCVSPKLSEKIIVLGIVHSDDPVHYEHVERLGRYWNGIVAVSQEIANKVNVMDPTFASRMTVIPYGITVPNQFKNRSNTLNAPLKIVYVGRLVEYQKRIQELPKIFHKLKERKIPFEATIIGDGEERESFLESCGSLVDQRIVGWKGILPNDEVQILLEDQDVIVLTSEFEGLPICVLEAMARGCVPVCMKIQSGLSKLIQDGKNGFLIEQGDIAGFVECLANFQSNPTKRQELSRNAYETVLQNYGIRSMLASYLSFLQRLISDSENGAYRRPAGKILPPPAIKISWKDHLPARIRLAGKKGRRYLRRVIQGSSTDEKTSAL
jgi:glycosyltransferase involved in cell wall biosynthesis